MRKLRQFYIPSCYEIKIAARHLRNLQKHENVYCLFDIVEGKFLFIDNLDKYRSDMFEMIRSETDTLYETKETEASYIRCRILEKIISKGD